MKPRLIVLLHARVVPQRNPLLNCFFVELEDVCMRQAMCIVYWHNICFIYIHIYTGNWFYHCVAWELGVPETVVWLPPRIGSSALVVPRKYWLLPRHLHMVFELPNSFSEWDQLRWARAALICTFEDTRVFLGAQGRDVGARTKLCPRIN